MNPPKHVSRLVDAAHGWDDSAKAAPPAVELPSPPARRLQPDERTQLIQRYQAGENIPELANALGINRQTIYQLFSVEKIQLRERGLNPEQAKRAAMLYKKGMSIARIGREIEKPYSVVRRQLIIDQVPLRARPGR